MTGTSLRPGYSLLEVLIAVAIIALATGLAIPGLLNGLEAREASSHFRMVEARLRALRVEAALDARAIRLEGDTMLAVLPQPGSGWRLSAEGVLAISPAGRCEWEAQDALRLTLRAPGGRLWARQASGLDCALQPATLTAHADHEIGVF
jgi:prepilin-type N-terminal cleavage/methylation domain-containing protein